jgi:predicted ATP-grasp superfamily ATP-dependent carboligase
MKVLVLDANQRSALAATRSLGRAGFIVATADERTHTLAGASRWSAQALVYPSPYRDADAFAAWAAAELAGFDAALPMTEVTTDLLLRQRARWPDLVLPFPDIAVVDGLSNKIELFVRARELGIRVPRSVIVQHPQDVDGAVAEIGLPAMLKPARSRIRRGAGFLSTSVLRVQDARELAAAMQRPEFGEMPFLFQEVVEGPGQGIFALYRNGEAVAFFAHRRLREKPPAGGVSVYSESCLPDPQLQASAARLLADAGWHGVAMVEFKGRYLMEVNARFWGSLQLAIDAGVDFPRLLLEPSLRGGAGSEPPRYRCGRRLRWFLGDLDRLYLVVRDSGLRRAAEDVARFLAPDPGRTRHEVFRWQDPKPAVREFAQYLRALTGGVSTGTTPAEPHAGGDEHHPVREKTP